MRQIFDEHGLPNIYSLNPRKANMKVLGVSHLYETNRFMAWKKERLKGNAKASQWLFSSYFTILAKFLQVSFYLITWRKQQKLPQMDLHMCSVKEASMKPTPKSVFYKLNR